MGYRNLQDFISRLEKGGKFDILQTTRDNATSLVRRGKRTAALVFPRGFGEALSRVFYGDPPRAEILIDPSRKAESAMMEGLLFQQAAEGMQKFFSDRTASQQMIHKALNDLGATPNIASQERAINSAGLHTFKQRGRRSMQQHHPTTGFSQAEVGGLVIANKIN